LKLLKLSIDEIRTSSSERELEPQPSHIFADVKDVVTSSGEPLPGTEPYDAERIEMEEVRVSPVRLKRAQPKQKAELSDVPRKGHDDNVPQLRFSSLVQTTEPGIDPRLLKTIETVADRPFVYGFIFLNEYLSPEAEKELTKLSFEILGPHSSAYKVRIPRDEALLRRVMALDYVEWIGLADPGQKLSRGLQSARERYAAELDRFPVVINLFEQEARGLAAENLVC
jgi:hypothetical protein